MRTVLALTLSFTLLVAACREDAGTPNAALLEGWETPAGLFPEPVVGPDPYVAGEARFGVGLFYEGGLSDYAPIDGTTSNYYIFEAYPGGPLTYTQLEDDQNRVEGLTSTRIAHAGLTFWGGGVFWSSPRDLSRWTLMHVSLRSASPAFAEINVGVKSGEHQADDDRDAGAPLHPRRLPAALLQHHEGLGRPDAGRARRAAPRGQRGRGGSGTLCLARRRRSAALRVSALTGPILPLSTQEPAMTVPPVRIRTPLLPLFVGLPLLLASGCDYQPDALDPPRVERGWTVVWQDEFDGAAGEAPDPTKWTFDLGRGDSGWGNDELQTYTDRADNVAQSGDGMLVITAREEARDGADYTSARLETQGLFGVTYGRIEARLQLPTGAGLWPAFWMLGDDITDVGWPECGEIDIMEYRGQSPDITQGSLHGPGYSGGDPISDVYFLPDGQGFDDDFHVFAVEWDPGRVAWYVDDVLFNLATTSNLPSGGRWVYDHAFFVILNLAVGGGFVGPPAPDTAFPQQLLIDYVRVLQRTP